MTHLRDQWRQRIAGPGGGVIPDRVKFRGPINIRQPRRVVMDPMARKDYDRLEPHERSAAQRAIRALENGKVHPEPKERELEGTYGLRLDADCRMLFYPHIDGSWHVYYLGDHDYGEATRRMSAPRERAASRSEAATKKVWRYIKVTIPLADAMSSKLPRSVLASIQEGRPPAWHERGHTPGVGVHWTSDHHTARTFEYPEAFVRSKYDGRGPAVIDLPVVLQGSVEPDAIEGDPEALKGYHMVQFDMRYDLPITESEVPVRKGAKVRVESMEVWLPSDTSLAEAKDNMERRGYGGTFGYGGWKTFPVGMAMTASLPSGLFWRAHPRGRPLSIEDATSTQLNPPHERRRGYSCYREPWDLWVYMYVQRVMFAPQDREVVGFEGQRVGGGNDGEDLATPIRPVVRMSWGSFEHELLTTPFPPRPLKLVRVVLQDRFNATWPSFAKTIRYQDDYHGDRVLERILETWDT